MRTYVWLLLFKCYAWPHSKNFYISYYFGLSVFFSETGPTKINSADRPDRNIAVFDDLNTQIRPRGYQENSPHRPSEPIGVGPAAGPSSPRGRWGAGRRGGRPTAGGTASPPTGSPRRSPGPRGRAHERVTVSPPPPLPPPLDATPFSPLKNRGTPAVS